jgi:hypothetical protein
LGLPETGLVIFQSRLEVGRKALNVGSQLSVPPLDSLLHELETGVESAVGDGVGAAAARFRIIFWRQRFRPPEPIHGLPDLVGGPSNFKREIRERSFGGFGRARFRSARANSRLRNDRT